jgi:hypothetical protein
LVPARIVEASGDQVLHAEPAHVAECHWRTVGLLHLKALSYRELEPSHSVTPLASTTTRAPMPL